MDKKIGLSDYFYFVDGVSQHLNRDFLHQVRDVELGQWELPFEAMLIELMKLPKQDVALDKSLAKRLATEANIVNDSVIDVNTWQKFCNWANMDKSES